MSRDTTDNARSFSIFFLNKHKKLVPDCSYFNNDVIWSRDGSEVARISYNISTLSSDSYIYLSYRIRRWGEEDWQPINYKVPLEQIPCHFGGKRWFFRCPLVRKGQKCDRRVAILYNVGDYFGCRKCANLTYESCQESKKFRGFPWKSLSDSFKADDLYKNVKVEYYNGKPTRKYKRCLDLWGYELEGSNADKQHG